MYFDYQDKLLVCTIDKVGSTTWLAHFKNLAAKRIPEFNLADTSRDETRDIIYALNKGTYLYVQDIFLKYPQCWQIF